MGAPRGVSSAMLTSSLVHGHDPGAPPDVAFRARRSNPDILPNLLGCANEQTVVSGRLPLPMFSRRTRC